MKFGQLILRKIYKFVATRRQILRLKCTKFNVGWGSAPDPAGGAYNAPQAYLDLRGPLRRREELGERRGGKGIEERKRRGPQGLVHTPCPKSRKISWLQNLSDWRGRQHRRLPRAANTLAPPLNKRICYVMLCSSSFQNNSLHFITQHIQSVRHQLWRMLEVSSQSSATHCQLIPEAIRPRMTARHSSACRRFSRTWLRDVRVFAIKPSKFVCRL